MIDILLATYNSERYLREQIDSIRNQSETGWQLLIRDAASTDSTVEIVRAYEREDPRIRLVEIGAAKSCENFARLLDKSDADYVMFADHDDVWLKDKIAKSMERLRALEAQFGRDAPLLVFTDAVVTDSALKTLSPSLLKWAGNDPRRVLPRQLALQNVANGNTMLFNAALRRRCGKIPSGALMHDYWMMLVASSFGHIGFVESPTLLYRQHGTNVLGASSFGAGYLIDRVRKGAEVARRRLCESIDQVSLFVDQYGDASPAVFKALRGIGNLSWLGRRRLLLEYRIAKCGLIRNLIVYALI